MMFNLKTCHRFTEILDN